MLCILPCVNDTFPHSLLAEMHLRLLVVIEKKLFISAIKLKCMFNTARKGLRGTGTNQSILHPRIESRGCYGASQLADPTSK